MPTKLIEVALPLDIINREAAREKSIRHGHPSTLHLWWARRPLAACRAVLFAQLVDDPSAHPEQFPTEEAQEVERQRLFRIIERLVPWEASNDETILQEARNEIRRCYPDGPPAIADPFCGGGSIPLEAQRLGLEAHASDLNPVAVLITKALIELPPKFANRPPVHPSDSQRLDLPSAWNGAEGLVEDVKWYGQWILNEAKRRIGDHFPVATLDDGTQVPVIAWVWARTVACPNPACRFTMPLVRSFWLGKKKGKETWIRALPDHATKKVKFEIGVGKAGPPVEGTVGRSGAVCVVCDMPVPLDHVRAEGRAGRLGAQLMAVVSEGVRERVYLPPSAAQVAAATVSRRDDAPDSMIPHNPRYLTTPNYGMTRHADLFTNRQLEALCTLSDLVGEAHARALVDSNGDNSYADAIATYLALSVDRVAMTGSSLVRWNPVGEKAQHMFGRQAVAMLWDFAEPNPLGKATGSWAASLAMSAQGLPVAPVLVPGTCDQEDAAIRHYEGVVVATDPPYYDNVGYADLSDVFYVWLRRSLQRLYPALLGTVLTPKQHELVADPYRHGDKLAATRHFELGFRKVFGNIAAQARTDTPSTVFYAFKQAEEGGHEDGGLLASTGWESMLEGLLDSGLRVTGTWPIRTEMATRLRNQSSNALASSIVLVCRPRSSEAGMTDRRGFVQALKATLARALRDLQSGGIAPVDLAQAAIGPGMAVFSGYAKVVESDGSPMRVRTALALINQVLDEVTAELEGEFDVDTRWAVAWYSQYGHDDAPFGRAEDLSKAKGVSVDGLVRAGIVKSGAGIVRLLDRDELDADWDPAADGRVTVWEVTQHLIRRLLTDGEASAAELLGRVGGLGDAARDLAYRLFQIAESKKWAKEAGPYNALAASWPEISRLAAQGPMGQGSLI